MILLLLACTAPPDDTGENTTDTAPDGPASLTDASNYSYTIALDIGETVVAPSDDLVVDWSPLTTDLRGFSVEPQSDVRAVDLVWLRDLEPDEVEAALVSGQINQSSVGLIAMGPAERGATSIALNRLDLYGTAFKPSEYMTQSGGSWLLRLSTYTNDEAMVHFLDPQEGGPTIAWLGDDSATLDFTPDLTSLTPVTVGPDLEIEWSGLTRDGRGAPIDALNVQELWIARYDLDVATLQARFFELETLATATWTLNVYGEDDATLTDAVDVTGRAFTGLTDDATWILALRCTICTAPAPVYLTVLAG